MKQPVSTIKLIAFIALSTFLWSACIKNKNFGAGSSETAEKKEEVKRFCQQFSVNDLLLLLDNYEDPKIVQKSGLPLIYRDKVAFDRYVPETEIVYGRGIEKGKKKEWIGYSLKAVSENSCFFKVKLDTSRQFFLCFSHKDDADSFFEKTLKYGLLECYGTYWIVEEKLPKTIRAESFEGYMPMYSLSRPKFEEGFYRIRLGVAE